ncbi:MAG: hypothetical protein Q9166_007077 [cf. Caloplaca sp. 2 TL-2023]
MSSPRPPGLTPADTSAQQACESGSKNFENVLRDMILGHASEQQPGTENLNSTFRQQHLPALDAPPPHTQDVPLPNQQQPLSEQTGRISARSGRNTYDRLSSAARESRPMDNRDAAALLNAPGDAPLPFSIRQARQPRRRQAAVDGPSNKNPLNPAVPSVEPSVADVSREASSSVQQPSSRLSWAPPANFTGHARPSNRAQLPQTTPQYQPQQHGRRGFQQGDPRLIPQASSYGRPPLQHHRLYDPHAATQQSYHQSSFRSPNYPTMGPTQKHHATTQAQVNYLDSLAQVQVPKAAISSEEEQEKEFMRKTLEDVCQKAITEYEITKKPLFDGSTVSLRCFGSLRTGFATQSSDMDLALESPLSAPDTGSSESEIPRVLEKALLDLGYGARLLTRTRVPIIRFCERPTSDLALRLREERFKWEKERDAPTKTKKPKESKDGKNPKGISKGVDHGKKNKGANAKQSKEKAVAIKIEDDNLEDEPQISKTTSNEQATEVDVFMDRDPVENVREEAAVAPSEEVIAEGVPLENTQTDDGDAASRDRDTPNESTLGSINSASTSSPGGSIHSKVELPNDLKDFITERDEIAHDTDAGSADPIALQQLSLSEGKNVSNHVGSRLTVHPASQVSALEEGAAPATKTIPVEPVQPKTQPETTLADEELVRRYRLAMKEGWFESKERTIIFAFIKAFESKHSQDLLDECRSQLLSLPDVLSRYRPPPEHHLDFPKDGVGVQCDINFSNRLAIHNSHMLRCYSASDPRVRPMVLFIKAWAKRRNINSPYHGTLSSYGYVLMVLHYLVNVTKPPICLNLQTVEMAQRDTSAENSQVIDGYNVRFWRDEKEIQKWARNSRITADHYSTVGSLLRGFFQYFSVVAGGFSWGTDVLSLRTPGGILTKQQKGWVAAKTVVLDSVVEGQKGQEVRQRYLFAIEDPFETNHNIARTVVHNGIVAIRDEFRRANKLIYEAGNGKPAEDLFEEAAAKDDLNYRHFGPRPRPTQETKAVAPVLKPLNDDKKKPFTEQQAENLARAAVARRTSQAAPVAVKGRLEKTQNTTATVEPSGAATDLPNDTNNQAG